jgi:hypothetical protein
VTSADVKQRPLRGPWPKALAGLVSVLCLAYLRVLFLGDTFAVRDHLSWTLPSRAFLAESLRRGHLPEWWDSLRLGERFAADPNNGVTYPLAWLVALMDPLFGADLLLLLHILLAGVGMLLVGRRLGASALGSFFGAAALMTSGTMTSMVVNGSILMALGWMPLLLWAGLGIAQVEERRDFFGPGLVFAVVLAGSVASGNPAHVNNGVLAGAAVLLCARKRTGALVTLAAATVLGMAMGAASLLPPLFTLSDSARAGGLTLAESGAWSMHPLRLIELVWPEFLGHGLRPETSLAAIWLHGGGPLEAIWAASAYVGLPVLLCAALAAIASGGVLRRLGLLSLVFVLLALGTFTPIYSVYRSVFRFEQVLRYPEKHLASALVLWTALAACGFDAWFVRSRSSQRALRLAAALTTVLLLSLGIGTVVRADLERWIAGAALARGIGMDAHAALAALLDGGRWAVFVGGAIVMTGFLAGHRRAGAFMRPAFVIASVAALIAHDWAVHVLVPRATVREKPTILSPLETPVAGIPTRILRRADDTVPVSMSGEARAALLYDLGLENAATRFGFAPVPGYSIAGTPRFEDLVKASGKATLERTMDLLDIRYLIIRAAEAGGMGMPLATPGALAGHVVLDNQERRARAYVAHRWQHLSDPQILDALFVPHRGDVDFGAIRLTGAGDGQASGDDAPSPCRIDRPVPEHVRLSCDAAKPGYAVLLDEWTRGWTASVDGRPAALERADTVFRAVAIPQGPHVVEMRYRTPGLRAGVAIACVGWCVFGALGVLCWRRRRPKVALGGLTR